MIKHLPNILSTARIVAMPLILMIAFHGERHQFFLLLALSQFTDFLDGYLARKLNAQSSLGAKLDIVGDSCNYVLGVTGICLFFPDLIEGWHVVFPVIFVLLHAARYGYAWIQTGELVYSVPHPSAKINFYVQSVLIACLLLDLPAVHVFFYAAFLSGLAESCFYLKGLRQLKQIA